MKAVLVFAFIVGLSGPAWADGSGSPDFSGKDAADAVFGKMGDLSGTPEERGDRIHNQTIDDQLDSIEKREGDAARLREERIYREKHKY